MLATRAALRPALIRWLNKPVLKAAGDWRISRTRRLGRHPFEGGGRSGAGLLVLGEAPECRLSGVEDAQSDERAVKPDELPGAGTVRGTVRPDLHTVARAYTVAASEFECIFITRARSRGT